MSIALSLSSLKMLVDILTSDGYQVHPADSGELALASVATSLPELILLDIRTPGTDGLHSAGGIDADYETTNGK